MDKVSESMDHKKRNHEFLVAYREHLINAFVILQATCRSCGFQCLGNPCIRRTKSDVAAFEQLANNS